MNERPRTSQGARPTQQRLILLSAIGICCRRAAQPCMMFDGDHQKTSAMPPGSRSPGTRAQGLAVGMMFKLILRIRLPQDARYKQCVRRAYSPPNESAVCMSIRRKPSILDSLSCHLATRAQHGAVFPDISVSDGVSCACLCDQDCHHAVDQVQLALEWLNVRQT